MTYHFGLREKFHGYPLIDVLIKARRYRLSMLIFVLDVGVSLGASF